MLDRVPSSLRAQGRLTGPILDTSEIQFHRLLEKLPAGAYTCEPTGLITYFNQHAVQIWGRAPTLNDPVDRFCGSFRLYQPDGTPLDHAQCWMALALRNAQEYNGYEIIIERPDGSRVTALAHANPIHDDAGTLIADLVTEGQGVTLVEGGRGGRGNAAFVSPKRRAPSICEQGEYGVEETYTLELKLMADAALVGVITVALMVLRRVIRR